MKILVYGAGVLGSLYAARLKMAGHQVSILARGARLVEIREQGILLVNEANGEMTRTRLEVVESLAPEDAYDLVIVFVRKNQLRDVLPALAADSNIPNVLFMVNNALGPDEMTHSLGAERVLIGFPGAGGTRTGPDIHYRMLSKYFQPTMLGEPDGRLTSRLSQIAAAFKAAGFPVALSPAMDAWLKTHVALVSPIANAIYLAGGDNYRLARTRDGLVLMARAIREGLQVIQALGVPITPYRYHLLRWIPEPLLVAVMRFLMNTSWAELVMTRHANAARDEMGQLANEFASLAHSTFIPTPALDELQKYIDSSVPALPAGSGRIPLDWRGFWAVTSGLAAVGFSLAWLQARQRKRA